MTEPTLPPPPAPPAGEPPAAALALARRLLHARVPAAMLAGVAVLAVAEVEQREAVVAAREAAVTQAEIERDQSSFGDGVWEVGVDIQPGKYKTAGGADCYWEKTSRSGDIIDNDLPSGPSTVIIDASVFTFSSQRCGEWTKVG